MMIPVAKANYKIYNSWDDAIICFVVYNRNKQKTYRTSHTTKTTHHNIYNKQNCFLVLRHDADDASSVWVFYSACSGGNGELVPGTSTWYRKSDFYQRKPMWYCRSFFLSVPFWCTKTKWKTMIGVYSRRDLDNVYKYIVMTV